jgi:hypothetical protein
VDGRDEGGILLTWFRGSDVTNGNDRFDSRTPLEGPKGISFATNEGATVELDEPDHANAGGTQSIWWSWIAPGDGEAHFTTAGSISTAGNGMDTVLAVYTGASLGTLQLIGESNDASDDDFTSAVTFPVTKATEYQIAVDGSGGDSGTVALSWRFEPQEGAARFLRGDVVDDGKLDLTDAVVIVDYLFVGGAVPPCLKAADVDDSGDIDLTDAVHLLGHLFLGGPPPSSPRGSCGADPTVDGLGCESHDACGR